MAAPQVIRVPSEEEWTILSELIAREKAGKTRYASRPPGDGYVSEHNDHQGPDCYVALPTEGEGIPGLTRSGTSTGTAVAQEGDIPGSAECDIYQLVEGDTNTLVLVSNLGEVVYNLNEEAIEQGWVLIHRTKFGQWVANIIQVAARMVITEGIDGTGTGTGSSTGASSDIAVVYRTSHPSGFDARLLDVNDEPIGETVTLYADTVRGVFATGDKVWTTRRNAKNQIRDTGRTSWTGRVLTDIQAGSSGTVQAFHDPNDFRCTASIYDSGDSAAATTIVLLMFLDGSQYFRAIPVACPSITAEILSEGTGTGS